MLQAVSAHATKGVDFYGGMRRCSYKDGDLLSGGRYCYNWRWQLLQMLAAVATNRAPPCCREADEAGGGATIGWRCYMRVAMVLLARVAVLPE
jgi:hypothetical protein